MKLEIALPKLKGANYEIVYADPSWLYYGDPNKDQAAGKHYDCMIHSDIAALPIKAIMAPCSVLFCWITSPLAFYQMLAISKWGLHYRGVTYIWVKTRKDGTPIRGQGVRPTLTKPTSEFLTAWTPNKRGRPFKIFSENQAQVHLLPRPKRHSEKPAIFRDLIVELCGDRKRIELWACDPIPSDWDGVGLDMKEDRITPLY